MHLRFILQGLPEESSHRSVSGLLNFSPHCGPAVCSAPGRGLENKKMEVDRPISQDALQHHLLNLGALFYLLLHLEKLKGDSSSLLFLNMNLVLHFRFVLTISHWASPPDGFPSAASKSMVQNKTNDHHVSPPPHPTTQPSTLQFPVSLIRSQNPGTHPTFLPLSHQTLPPAKFQFQTLVSNFELSSQCVSDP